MPKAFYVTTPIYYVNSVPHVGHALTMLVADITKRYAQMCGREAFFLTGTDENGLKVLEAAQSAGEDPMAFVDRISRTFQLAADELGIDYDVFFRTTSAEHKACVQALFAHLQEKGYVYLDRYEGWYDVNAEAFVKEGEVADGKSPDGNPVRWVSEENYFFKLSGFGDRLLAHAQAHPEFWLPAGRRAEVTKFVEQGLRDICITRANPGWGIPVPGDESKVVYVWFDALINYLSATGWPNPGWEARWPADVHWMAKEIFTRFHATLWPAILLAAEIPLPKSIIAHGWFTFKGEKQSKSKGNVIAPADMIATYTEGGVEPEIARDVVRYLLARALPQDNDTNFTTEETDKWYTADLANDLGNVLNRTVAMVHKFLAGVVPSDAPRPEVIHEVAVLKGRYVEAMEGFRLADALDAAMQIARYLNGFIQLHKPWELASKGDPSLSAVLASLLFGLRAAEGMLRPFMPSVADALLAQLGYPAREATTLVNHIGGTSLNAGSVLPPATPLFPRLDPQKSMDHNATPARSLATPTGDLPAPEIEFADFAKVELRVARVLEAEAVEKSEKLIRLQVMLGEEKRQIIAGILKSYNPADLVGRQIIVVANLKPRKLAGFESQGMVLAADGPDGAAILLTPEVEAPEGTAVH